MMMAILGNSVCLAIYDYSDSDDIGSWNKTLGLLDSIFTGFYTFEAFMKILAYGFVVHRKSYLRDAWNVLDFISLLVSYISLMPGVPNFKPMRILRVMKPLRSVNSMPTMKKLFNTLIMSLPQIGQVVLFMLFVFGIFAILGN
jgi:Ion transport protein